MDILQERHTTIPSATGDADWRQDAMTDALTNAGLGPPRPILNVIAYINRNAPGRCLRLFSEERRAALATFERLSDSWKSVMVPAHNHLAEDEADPSVLLYGWWRGKTSGPDAQEFEVVLIPSFKGKAHFIVIGDDDAKLKALIDTVVKEAEANRSRCRIFNNGWTDAPEIEAEIAKTSWNDVVLPHSLRTDIESTVAQFFGQREIFERMRFPWRRGILLVGPPGTGKTLICKATAAAFPQYPFLYVRDVGKRGTNDVEAIFRYARKLAPCILAFEDVDSLFDDTKRAIFLNELDGFQNNDGLLIIASSNHPERIDIALLKRPSRFDRVYHIGLPAHSERRAYTEHLLSRAPNLDPDFDRVAFVDRVAELTESFTPAFLKEAFISGMLQSTQEGRTVLDAAFGRHVIEQIETLRTILKQANNPALLNEVIGASTGDIGFRSRRQSRAVDEDED